MAFFDRRTVSVLLTILAFAGLLAVVWLARLPIVAFINNLAVAAIGGVLEFIPFVGPLSTLGILHARC